VTAIAIHEAANIFPMEDETIQELADDIGKHGQHVPIELLDGKVIDGRRRLAACAIADVEPQFIYINTDDPVAYVLSLNLHRRQLTASQRSMVGARSREVYDKLAKERQRAAGGDKKSPVAKSVVAESPQPIADHKRARDEVGNVVGVSGRGIDRAKAVLEYGTPELIKAVDDGVIAVTSAAEIAKQPAHVQQATVVAAKSGSRKPKGTPEIPEGELQGKGVIRANEAINCLTRIPKNDALRSRGLQIVADWIRKNK
jgi:hypothetical protein